jgi:hypothetical protein
MNGTENLKKKVNISVTRLVSTPLILNGYYVIQITLIPHFSRLKVPFYAKF